MILHGKRNPSYPVAKKLAAATNTSIDLWMEGTPEQKRKAVAGKDPKFYTTDWKTQPYTWPFGKPP